MLKKLLLINIVVISVASLFSNSNTEFHHNASVNVLGFGDPKTEESRAFINNIESFIYENSDVDISWRVLDAKEYNSKLGELIKNDLIPDIVFILNQETLNILENYNLLYDHSKLEVKNILNQTATFSYSLDNSLPYIPVNKRTHLSMFANMELLNRYGFTIAKSYDELKTQLDAIKDSPRNLISYPGLNDKFNGSVLVAEAFARYGGQELLKDLSIGYKYYTDQEVIYIFDIIKQFYTDGIISEDSLEKTYSQALSDFNQGNSLYYIDYSSNIKNIELVNFSENRLFSFPEEIFPNNEVGEYLEGWAIVEKNSSDLLKIDGVLTIFNNLFSENSFKERSKYLNFKSTLSNINNMEGENIILSPEIVLNSKIVEAYSKGVKALWSDEISSQDLGLLLNELN